MLTACGNRLRGEIFREGGSGCAPIAPVQLVATALFLSGNLYYLVVTTAWAGIYVGKQDQILAQYSITNTLSTT